MKQLIITVFLFISLLHVILPLIDLLPSDSHCYGAFPNENHHKITESIFHFDALPSNQSFLKSINVGFGTTGTKSFFQYETNRFSYVCHNNECQPKIKINPLNELLTILKQCLHMKSINKQCETNYFLMKTSQLLIEISTNGIESISDTLIPYFYRELIDLNPSIEIFHTLRQPHIWIMKRIFERYDVDIICDIHRPDIANIISSPFHIFKCIQNTKYIYENLIFLGDFMKLSHSDAMMYSMGTKEINEEHQQNINEVARYFIEYNMMVVNTIEQKKNKYKPICVWDKNFP